MLNRPALCPDCSVRPDPASSGLLPDLNRLHAEYDWEPARQGVVLRSRTAAEASR